jgi:hypothetical protein
MTLREYITANCSGMTVDAILAAINTETIATNVRQLVPLWKIKKFCFETGIWVAMKATASQTENANLSAIIGNRIH